MMNIHTYQFKIYLGTYSFKKSRVVSRFSTDKFIPKISSHNWYSSIIQSLNRVTYLPNASYCHIGT